MLGTCSQLNIDNDKPVKTDYVFFIHVIDNMTDHQSVEVMVFSFNIGTFLG